MARIIIEGECPDCGGVFIKQYEIPEALEAKPESSAIGCSADGSAAPVPSESGVQPAGPSRTLEGFELWIETQMANLNSQPAIETTAVDASNYDVFAQCRGLIDFYRSEVG